MSAFKETPYRGEAMITSKLTTKAQTTIPLPIGHALRLRADDEISHSIEDDVVTMRKVSAAAIEDPRGTLNERDTDANRIVYRHL
jgi:antitoxin PrlF